MPTIRIYPVSRNSCHFETLITRIHPVWPIVNDASGGYNLTGIVLTALAIHNFYTRTSSAEDVPSPSAEIVSESTTPTPTHKHSILNALALGSLIFSLHSLVAESSTLIAWSWTGYPIKGPVPHLHGSLTHIAQAIGILIPVASSSLGYDSLTLLTHPAWFAYGAFSTCVLYFYNDWLGYFGGCNLAVFFMSIVPVVLARVAGSRSIAKTFTVAMLVVALFYVGSVFTVAYAFVPGGQVFRERTNW